MTDLVRSVAADSSGGAQASITQLADVALPPPVSWKPQTVGWDVLGVLLLVLALWAAWRAVRRYRHNRYRRDALAELERIETQWAKEPEDGTPVLVALPPLIKRCALAAWPREQVAGLSGAQWAQFLEDHAGHATHGARALAPLVREIEYHDAHALSRIGPQDVRVLLAASRQWIEGHVSA
ncbi:DUF4381 domain-containing protein [Variovorax sp. J22R133]|uniref:DUF4381 domain-containing protein n=1 Tax=Variovorax brevis TaxID=3053503 RepID=UPI00257618DA|nr:DUF4381 domain-containing protein [Variovorax sp. J22R133]MDM0111078.1 DUF4381 domain-containing protein [Variovorax sp. J22R133]